jgi:hypothetical protein
MTIFPVLGMPIWNPIPPRIDCMRALAMLFGQPVTVKHPDSTYTHTWSSCDLTKVTL